MQNPEQAVLIQSIRQEAELAARVTILEARVQSHDQELHGFHKQLHSLTTSLAGLKEQLNKQQLSIDSIAESMVFVQRLEDMDGKLSFLLKAAKGLLMVVGSAGALVIAFQAKDGTALMSVLSALGGLL